MFHTPSLGTGMEGHDNMKWRDMATLVSYPRQRSGYRTLQYLTVLRMTGLFCTTVLYSVH